MVVAAVVRTVVAAVVPTLLLQQLLGQVVQIPSHGQGHHCKRNLFGIEAIGPFQARPLKARPKMRCKE